VGTQPQTQVAEETEPHWLVEVGAVGMLAAAILAAVKATVKAAAVGAAKAAAARGAPHRTMPSSFETDRRLWRRLWERHMFEDPKQVLQSLKMTDWVPHQATTTCLCMMKALGNRL